MRLKNEKLLILSAVIIITAGCTSIRKELCVGCIDSLTKQGARKYKDTNLAGFMKDRFSNKLGELDSIHDYNKLDKKDNSITVQLISYHVDRPYDDLSAFCSIKGGKLLLSKKGKKPAYRSTKDIKKDAEKVFQTSKENAPETFTIDTGLDLKATYKVNKSQYALAEAEKYYQNEVQYKKEIEDTSISKKYDDGKFGSFICRRQGKNLWAVEISYQSRLKEDYTTWYNVKIKPHNYA